MKYTMTEDEFNEIYEISRPVPLVIIAGENMAQAQAKRADQFWQSIAEKYKCKWRTICPDYDDNHSFWAEPLEDMK